MPAPSALDTLIEAAVLAPSGDNTQPWRFEVDREAWTITIDVDPSRDPSPMNAGQRMAWIAIGAAIENVLRTAEYNGWQCAVSNTNGEGPVVVNLGTTAGGGAIEHMLRDRCTNRRVYEGGSLSSDCLDRLRSAIGEMEGVKAHWVTDSDTICELTGMIARADGLILGTKPIREAFLAKVRFDQPANAVVEEGLSLGSLEVGAHERLMLRLLRHVPDGVLRALGGRNVFASVAKRLAASSSGFCLILAPDDELASRIAVGRVWQRAWLAVSEQGLAAQPMMSLCVLRNMRDHADGDLLRRIGSGEYEALIAEFENRVAEIAEGRPAALMRFGRSGSPTARVGRKQAGT